MINVFFKATPVMTIALLAAACGSGSPHSAQSCKIEGPDCLKLIPEQIRVLDADSFVVEGLNIRLAEMDAPEAGNRAQCESERELGDEAKAFVEGLINGAEQLSINIVDRQGTIAVAAIFADDVSIGRELQQTDRASRWNRLDDESKPDWCEQEEAA